MTNATSETLVRWQRWSRACLIALSALLSCVVVPRGGAAQVVLDQQRIVSSLGLFSGLAFESSTPSALRFWGVSDGGEGGAPFLAHLQQTASGVQLLGITRIQMGEGTSIDAEGGAFSKDGTIWIADERGPALVHLDSAGGVIERVAIGSGLSAQLRSMQPNRGFEGIGVFPSGKVVAAMQSTLDIGGATKNSALFIRFVQYDPHTRTSKMFAYPLSPSAYESRGEVKIGDISVVREGVVAVTEHGKRVGGSYTVRVYLVTVAGASDITRRTIAKKPLEYVRVPAKLFGSVAAGKIHPLRKRLLVDMSALGWNEKKPEALMVLPDHRSLVISADGGASLSSLDAANGKIGNFVQNNPPKHKKLATKGVPFWTVRLSRAF